jgi:hypothetical protein
MECAVQGNRISKERQLPGEVGFIPAGSLDFAPGEILFRGLFA